MEPFLYTLLGYVILGALAFATVYGLYLKAITQPLYAFLYSTLILGSFVVSIMSEPKCTCIANSFFFRDLTIQYNEFIQNLPRIIAAFILLMALGSFMSGYGYVRTIAPRISMEAAINLFVLSIWVWLQALIVSRIICPLICDHYLDWDSFKLGP